MSSHFFDCNKPNVGFYFFRFSSDFPSKMDNWKGRNRARDAGISGNLSAPQDCSAALAADPSSKT